MEAAAGLPFSTREVKPPPWLGSLNASGEAYLEAVEDSPFLLQQIMPLLLLLRAIPESIGHRLSKIAAAIANLGLFTAQLLALMIMTTLLLFFLAIDKGYECCKREGQRKAEVSVRDAWWDQLTSWEAMPGVEIGPRAESDFHLG